MPESNSLLVGYTPAVIALCAVLAYFLLLRFVLMKPDPPRPAVVSYEPPPDLSPALAAWLLEASLARALAAAFVNMAAKRFLLIEQAGRVFSITKLKDASLDCLEPEEDALAYRLFEYFDSFEFEDNFDSEELERLRDPLVRFEDALHNRTYFPSNFLPLLPAWIVSGAASIYALFEGIDASRLQGSVGWLFLLSVIVIGSIYAKGLSTMGGAIKKTAAHIAGRDIQQRPWNNLDAVGIICLFLTAAAVYTLALIADLNSALILAAFLLLNAVFYQELHTPNAAGKKLVEEAVAYREFLGAVDAGPLARTRPDNQVPANLCTKDAYAIALHLDLGWGESFVTALDAKIGEARSPDEPSSRGAYQVYRDLR
jgi:Predicted membrane protein (DUF2207)